MTQIEKTTINGVELAFSLNPESCDKPLVLYLHGGPGMSSIPLMEKFNAKLEQELNFINLEQRGAGLSYYKFSDPVEIATFVEDVHQFVKYLLVRFHREQLVLVGHSWGSVLGLLFIQKYPELVSKYIGVGQVVNIQKNVELQKQFLNLKDLKISTLALNRKVVKQGGSIYGHKSNAKLVWPFLTSSTYSFKTLINFLKGSKQSLDFLWGEILKVNFEDVTDYEVPIYFFEGRHDHHVSSSLVESYAKTIKSEASLVWFEQSGHYPQWEEPNRFNAELIKASYH